jgi:hypothetical protein
MVLSTALVLALTAVPLVASTTLAAPTPLGVNLVRNPGAEAGAGTNGYTTVAIPDWDPLGNFTVIRYGAPGFPTKAESARIGGGKRFFSCGPNADFGHLYQNLKIKGRGGPIDAGLIRVRLKVRQAGYANGSDEARTWLYYLNADGHRTGGIEPSVTTGTFGLFQLKKATAILPAGTRGFQLLLEGQRGNDGGSYCDAYFDNVSVKLQLVN